MKPFIDYLDSELNKIKDKLSTNQKLEREQLLSLFLASLLEEDAKK